ncbi:MAG TPA: hypothetical protein VK015_08800 [Microbacterium sp.]|nr:hypothetical protein [Microbacterium sp.]
MRTRERRDENQRIASANHHQMADSSPSVETMSTTPAVMTGSAHRGSP